MPRRTEIIATASESTQFFPHRKLSANDLLAGSFKVAGRLFATVNQVAVPGLVPGWANSVLPRFPRTLTDDEIAKLRSILNAYAKARMACVHPITWRALKARLERISEKSAALLDELNDWSADYEIAWRKISREAGIRGGQPFTHNDVYPVVSRLAGLSTLALEQTKRARQAGSKGSHRAPWNALVCALANLFEQTGGRATAAKNLRGGEQAKPSPFVWLVWWVMNAAVPPVLREHAHTPVAMANQVSRALSARKQLPGSRDGTICPDRAWK